MENNNTTELPCYNKEFPLMHIHYLEEVDLEVLVDLFARKHPRRLELGTLLNYSQIESFACGLCCIYVRYNNLGVLDTVVSSHFH